MKLGLQCTTCCIPGLDTCDTDSPPSLATAVAYADSRLTESGVVDGFAGVYSNDDHNDQACYHAEDQGELGVSAYL